MRRVIIKPDAAGILRDQEGHRYNDNGDMVDEQGTIIPEAAPVDDVAAGQRVVAAAAPPARGRTLADFNMPDQFYANRSAIRHPPFQRHDFELKPAYFTLVGQHPFHGLSSEHSMDHIEKFEDLVTSIKLNGVSEDYLYCKLFKYSLTGDAAYWLKNLQPGSLTNWNDTKNVFLNNFFDDARSEDLRTKISAFSQGPTEAFRACWLRFRAYQRDCPHHGFSDVQLLGTFFRGIDWRYQMALDAASEGNFNTRSPEEAQRLIENLVASNSTKNADFDRKQMAENKGGVQSAAMNSKLDSIHNLLVGKKQVHFAAEVETLGSEEEDVNYINGTGSYGQRFGNQQGYGSSYQKPFQGNGGFNRNYGSSSYKPIPPPTSENKIESMLEQLLEGQTKMTIEFNGKLDSVYTI